MLKLQPKRRHSEWRWSCTYKFALKKYAARCVLHFMAQVDVEDDGFLRLLLHIKDDHFLTGNAITATPSTRALAFASNSALPVAGSSLHSLKEARPRRDIHGSSRHLQNHVGTVVWSQNFLPGLDGVCSKSRAATMDAWMCI